MKTLYIECAMGAAGDMLAAALLELLPDRAAFLAKMNGLGIPGVTVSAEKGVKCGVSGTHFSVRVAGVEEDENLHSHHHDHVHGSMEGIEEIVNSLPIPSMVKLDILAVYNLIAEAESRVHGVPVQQIHFHEVGTLDALVCNPPYVTAEEMTQLEPSVRDYEPALALDGGADGLDFYRSISANWGSALRKSGWLVYEIGKGQEQDVAAILQQQGFSQITQQVDGNGIVRVVAGQK
mgnify:CR=1 FL=1